MSDFRFDIGFQVLGQRNITAVRRELAAAGYSLDTVERTTRRVGNALHNLQKIKIKGLVDPADEARIKRIVNQFGGGVGPSKFKTTDQVAQSQREIERARNTEIRARLALERLDERRRRLQERQDAQAERARERILQYEQKIRLILEKQVQKRQEIANLQSFKDSERILAVQNKIVSSQVNLGNKTAEQQQKIRDAVGRSTQALNKAKEQARLYHEAMMRGDTQAAARHKYLTQVFVRESNAAANAAVSAANKQVKANQQVNQSQLGLIQNVTRLRYMVNAVGYGLGVFAITRGINNLTRAIGGAFLESVKFNDELARGKVLLTSFGINHLGNKSIEDIVTRGTENEKEDLRKARAFSANMMNVIREQAAYTGQDMAEVISIVRMALPDLMNKWGGEGNVFLQEGDKVEDFTKKFIQLSSVLKMYDNQRKLPFHAFAITEAFSGTADAESKGRAAANFISLIRRENIKVADEYQRAITAAINSGDPFKAMDVMAEALVKAGVTTSKIKDLHSQTLATFSSVVANLRMFFAEITNPAYETLINFFKGFSSYLIDLGQNTKFLAYIRILGQTIDQQVTRALDWAIGKLDTFMQFMNTAAGQTRFFEFINHLKNSIDTFVASMRVLGAFFAGLFGFEKDMFGTNAEGIRNWIADIGSMKTDIEAMIGPAQEFGRELHNITSSLTVIAAVMLRIASFARFFFGDEDTRLWGIEGKTKRFLGYKNEDPNNGVGLFWEASRYGKDFMQGINIDAIRQGNLRYGTYAGAYGEREHGFYRPNPADHRKPAGSATITQQITGPVTIVANDPVQFWKEMNAKSGTRQAKTMEDALNAVGIGVGLGGLATYQR